jgi:phage/plasmid-like protein (TIGR03299 family)
MPANVGEMFYTGEVPWHGLGLPLARPATLAEALKAGGLNWRVGEVDLQTCDTPPSPVPRRKAIVRADRAQGDAKRVLGVTHLDFKPVQNEDAALLFDAIFGQGKPVYHTGGYLGAGEVIWLLAEIKQPFDVGTDDPVQPYALLANSHDGSRALSISLTTIRVVCQNTLQLALQQPGLKFRRAHSFTYYEHAAAAQVFFAGVLKELEMVTGAFTRLATVKCDDVQFRAYVEALLPLPARPRDTNRSRGALTRYETLCRQIEEARAEIGRLRHEGQGAGLDSARGKLWGALNAVTEYVDHYCKSDTDAFAYALLGDGVQLKMRAYRKAQEMAA